MSRLSAIDLKPGTEVGSVRLIRQLDAGGMGAIWVAEDAATRMQVAVKFMLEELAEREPTARERFEREARVLARVQHPNIVRLFDSGALADGTPYIVMELLAGESFVERLERTGTPLSLSQLTSLLEQVCAALEHIHGLGIVHRDLKGENTFLLGTSDKIVLKVIDFGLAKDPDLPGQPKLTVPGQQIGSPEYMSPEQVLSSGDVDAHADLWAVGVLAYVALALEFPFRADNLPELLGAIREGKFKPITAINPALPPGIDAWFSRAFNLEMAGRFGSAGEMLAAWNEATRAPGFPKRTFFIAAAVAAVVIIAAVVALALG